MANQEIVAFDLEGTLTAGIAWEGMRDYLVAHGEGNNFRRLLLRNALHVLAFRIGIIRDRRAFQERWILDMMRLFSGYSPEQFAEMAAWVTEKTFWPNRRPSVITELLNHKENGRHVIIVSGMFEPLLQKFAARLQVASIGTPVAVIDGRLTGEIIGQLNVGQRKVDRLAKVPGNLFMAYGDTARDIPMLRHAETAVAVHPDKLLHEEATKKGWRILRHFQQMP